MALSLKGADTSFSQIPGLAKYPNLKSALQNTHEKDRQTLYTYYSKDMSLSCWYTKRKLQNHHCFDKEIFNFQVSTPRKLTTILTRITRFHDSILILGEKLATYAKCHENAIPVSCLPIKNKIRRVPVDFQLFDDVWGLRQILSLFILPAPERGRLVF